MILICYDGSPASRAALERGVELFPNEPATVLCVWEPLVEALEHSSFAPWGVPVVNDESEIDDRARKAADKTAAEGAAIARTHGVSASPRSAGQATTTGRAILATAEDLHASALVVGSRVHRGIKELELGSVASEVLRHADRAPVVVVRH
jgi:nucleotide-binding universal stress UspA family protein